MARNPEPRWHKARRRWVSNIGEPLPNGRAGTVYFPRFHPTTGRPIDERDKDWAYTYQAWYREQRRTAPAAVSSSPTLAEVLDAYLGDLGARATAGRVTAAHLKATRSLVGRLCMYRQPDGTRLADRPSDTLGPADLEGVVHKLQELGRSPHYVDAFCRVAMAAMNWAIRRGPGREALLASNPFVGFKAPTLPVSPERFAERSVAARWLWYLRLHANAYKPGTQGRRFARSLLHLVWLLIRTGARPGEACDLRWSDLKPEAGRTPAGHRMGRVQIPPDRWKTGGKTGKMRTIYLYPPLVRLLERLARDPERHRTHVFVHGRGRGGKGSGEPWASGSVLSKTITRLRREMMADQEAIRGRRRAGEPVGAVAAWLAEADLSDEGPNRIVNYLWRHTAASTLIMMGIDLATIAEQLGTSVEMLRKHYGHLIDAHLQAAAVKFAYGRRGA